MDERIEEKQIVINPEWTGAGVAATIRWDVFEQYLRDAGKLHHDEHFNGVVVSKHGLRYYIGQD